MNNYMPGKTFGPRKPYLSIVQGTLRQKVDQDTKNAVKREYELKNGQKGIKYELIYKEWFGVIRKLTIKDSEYGETLEVEFDDAVITINTESRYFADFVKKLMGANINQTISIAPFDWEPEPGKRSVGVTLTQNGEKLKNYYWNDVDKTPCNGIPMAPKNAKKTFKKDDWKMFFLTTKKFLIEELEKIKSNITENIPEESTETPNPEKMEEEEREDGEVRVEDIPF